MTDTEAAADPVVISSPWRRLAAAGYDLLLLVAVLMFSGALAVAFVGSAIEAGNPAFQAYLLLSIFLYFAIFWKRAGYTPGMRPWRMRIERLDGSPLGWREVMVRFAMGWVSLAAFGLGFLWAFFDSERRMWHDRASGTRVVKDWRLYK